MTVPCTFRPVLSYPVMGDTMNNSGCDPLALTTSVNTLAVAIASRLNDADLGLTAAILTQLGDTLETIAAQRERCAPPAAGGLPGT